MNLSRLSAPLARHPERRHHAHWRGWQQLEGAMDAPGNRRTIMWEVDNDLRTLWRLEHELGRKRIDRLLNSVTTSDRPERFNLARPNIARLAELMRRLWRRRWPLLPPALIVRRRAE